jgi:surfactin synthase thioesterase subunit
MSTLDQWFPYRRGTGDFELFAVPHIGAGSTVFNELRSVLAADGVALSAAVLPGHGRRIRERPHDRMDELLADFAEAAGHDGFAAFDRQYGLLGHCSGALVAYELARILVEAPCPDPRLLVVCSCLPPMLVRDTGIARLSSHDLFAYTASTGGTAPELIEDADFRQLLEPVLRADWALVEGYSSRPGAGLPVPILAVRGHDDPLVDTDDLLVWGEYTSAMLRTAELGSGHWALHGDGSAALARQIGIARGLGAGR